MDRNFQILVKFCKRIWLMKAELKKLQIYQHLMKCLIILFMHLIVIQMIWTMKAKIFMLHNLYGHLRINLVLAILSSRFIKIGKVMLNSLFMQPSAKESLMNCKKDGNITCLMLYSFDDFKRRAYYKWQNTLPRLIFSVVIVAPMMNFSHYFVPSVIRFFLLKTGGVQKVSTQTSSS